MKFVPDFFMLVWSVLAIGYALRRGSAFRWGMGGKGPLAPQWFGRLFFLTTGVYGLFWSFVTGGEDFGFLQPSSMPALVLRFINSHVGTLLVDALLGIGFLGFAFRSFMVFRHQPERGWPRMVSLGIALITVTIGIFWLVRLTLRLVSL